MQTAQLSLWIIVIIAGMLTFLIRLSFIALLADWNMPPLMRSALRFVPPAVLCAMIFPEIMLRHNELALGSDNYRLLAAIAAVAVAWRFGKIMPTIAVGMALLWSLQLLA